MSYLLPENLLQALISKDFFFFFFAVVSANRSGLSYSSFSLERHLPVSLSAKLSLGIKY